jgi:peptidoglycan DL-endopeptidase CwlO
VQFRLIAKLVQLPKQRSFAAGLAGSAAELAPRVMRRQPLLLAFLCAVVLLGAVPALADPTVAEKRAEAGQVLEQVQQLDASLAQVIQAYDLATERLNRVHQALRENGKNLAIARASLKRAQHRYAARLREIYTSGGGDSALDVLVGATSLDDLLNRINTTSRIASADAQIVQQVQSFRNEVQKREARLKQARRSAASLVAERAAARHSVESQLAQRRQLLSSIRGQIAQLQAQERARQAELRRELQARLAAQEQQAREQALGNTFSAPAPAESTGSSDPATSAPSTPVTAPSRGNVVAIAMRYLGVPYRWGGASPSTGFDCSGFTMYVYAQVGIALPHYTGSQYAMGVPVPRSQLQPGDLVFFDGLGHEGLYVGNNQFIHAPHTGDVVKISSISGWYASTYVGARRV